jgi:hypothetical protein
MDDSSLAPSAVDLRSFRAGVVAGGLVLIAVLGAVKDLYALLKPNGRGQLILGFLMLRYTSAERVWFGYRFTGDAAWFAAIPHVVIYAAAAVGLVGLRRWGWWLLFTYVVYIPVSEGIFALLYPFGYLTNHPYDASLVRAEWFFILVSLPLELLALVLLWRYKKFFVR